MERFGGFGASIRVEADVVGHALGVPRGYLWPLSLLYAGASWAVASSLALGAFPCLADGPDVDPEGAG